MYATPSGDEAAYSEESTMRPTDPPIGTELRSIEGVKLDADRTMLIGRRWSWERPGKIELVLLESRIDTTAGDADAVRFVVVDADAEIELDR